MFDTLIIAALCGLLGSPSWHTRELAHRALQARPDAVPMLRACQGCKSPEIAGRATQILSGIYRANAERLTAGMGPMPWLDMLPWEQEGRQELLSRYLARAQSKVGRCLSPEWTDYREASRLMVIDLFRTGASPESVRALLEEMRKNEIGWVAVNGYRYQPPLELPPRRS